MQLSTSQIKLPLFIPGDRQELLRKACACGADAVIIDLEDAVAPSDKVRAREGLSDALQTVGGDRPAIIVRVNAVGTPWFEQDIATCRQLPLAAVMLPKAETAADVERAAGVSSTAVFALIESALGLHRAMEIASRADRLLFGSIDFAADIGCAHTRDALLHARSVLVIASRANELAAPIDGVTTAIHDAAEVESDAKYAVGIGFGGKLLIHPAQLAPARKGILPSDADISWALRVMDAAKGAASAVDGHMVDAPVLLRAQNILERRLSPSAQM